MTVEQFAIAVLVYCRAQRASVTSWYRTPLMNHRLRFPTNSPHTFGLAVDVIYDLPVTFDHAVLFAEHLELRLIREKAYDHIEPLEWRAPVIRATLP